MASFDESKQTQVSPLVAKCKVEPVYKGSPMDTESHMQCVYSFGFHNQISL